MSDFLAIGKIGADLGWLCEVVTFDANAGNPATWALSAKLRKAKSTNHVPAANDAEDIAATVQFTPVTTETKANFSFSVGHIQTTQMETGIYCVIPTITFASGLVIKDGPFYIQMGEG